METVFWKPMDDEPEEELDFRPKENRRENEAEANDFYLLNEQASQNETRPIITRDEPLRPQPQDEEESAAPYSLEPEAEKEAKPKAKPKKVRLGFEESEEEDEKEVPSKDDDHLSMRLLLTLFLLGTVVFGLGGFISASLFAGLAGVVTLFAAVFEHFVKPRSVIVNAIWWSLFFIYLFAIGRAIFE
ncbi:Hypothetical protein PBC10988_17560 [Planctomycetales bacterium 10988]|nr:Hypothetical protein PBC10988_17560 [Planctomycetales bacterium 10988]